MTSNKENSSQYPYKSLFEHLPDGAVIFNQQGHLMGMNEAARRILDDKLSEKSESWDSLLVQIFHSEGRSIEVEQDGQFYKISKVDFFDENNQPAGKYILIQDITWYKQAEENAYNQSEARANELLILKNLAEVLNQTLPPEKALEAGLKMVANQFGAPSGWLLTLTPDQKADLSAGYNLPANMELARASERPWALCNCLRESLNGRLNAPIRIFDCERLARTSGIPENEKQHLSIPVRASGVPVGILNLVIHSSRYFNNSEIRLLSALGDQFGGAIERARLFKEVHKLAVTDSLTGLANRRHFYDLLGRELERSRRYKHPVSLAILDIDHFKKVNDTYGHLAGDLVLQEVARVCQEAIRKIDLVGRFGGEEIVIVMPETTQKHALQAMERLRQKIENLPITTPRGIVKVTISIGMSSHFEKDPTEAEKLIDQADQALYHAKNNGRNQVCVWQNGEEDTINCEIHA